MLQNGNVLQKFARASASQGELEVEVAGTVT